MCEGLRGGEVVNRCIKVLFFLNCNDDGKVHM